LNREFTCALARFARMVIHLHLNGAMAGRVRRVNSEQQIAIAAPDWILRPVLVLVFVPSSFRKVL